MNNRLENARKDLVAKSKELFLRQWMNKGHICENYNSQTGECDDVNRCELFYHWGDYLALFHSSKMVMSKGQIKY